ncbi:ketosamine-3-kinase, partial [Silurus meridionalis]
RACRSCRQCAEEEEEEEEEEETWGFVLRNSEEPSGSMMEQLLKRELCCSTVKAVGLSGGGCISEGQSYCTDSGTVFAKINHKSQ